jgi:lipoprotein-releasing system permease protein
MGFSFFIARHYLFSSKAKGATARMSLIAVLVSAIAIAMPLIVLSVLNGFHETIKDTRLEKSFHLKVSCNFSEVPTHLLEQFSQISIPDPEKQSIWSSLFGGSPSETLIQPVRLATPFLEGQALIRSPQNTQLVLVRGIHKSLLESDTFSRSFEITPNRGSFDLEGNKIVIGKALADELHIPVTIGKLEQYPIVTLIAEKTRETEDGKLESYFDPIQYGVTGVFESGLQEVDGLMIFMALESAQKLQNKKGISGIGIQLTDRSLWNPVKSQITSILADSPTGCGFPRIYNWKKLNEHMFFALEWEKTLLALVMTMMLIASFLTIFLALNVVIMDKRKEIGILMSLGVKPGMVRSIFLSEGLLIGLTGAIIGLVVGIWVVLSLTDVLNGIEAFMTWWQHLVFQSPLGVLFWESEPEPFKLVQSRIFKTDFIPYIIRLPEVIMLFIGAVVTAWLASLLPALRATRQKPMEILRYE